MDRPAVLPARAGCSAKAWMSGSGFQAVSASIASNRTAIQSRASLCRAQGWHRRFFSASSCPCRLDEGGEGGVEAGQPEAKALNCDAALLEHRPSGRGVRALAVAVDVKMPRIGRNGACLHLDALVRKGGDVAGAHHVGHPAHPSRSNLLVCAPRNVPGVTSGSNAAKRPTAWKDGGTDRRCHSPVPSLRWYGPRRRWWIPPDRGLVGSLGRSARRRADEPSGLFGRDTLVEQGDVLDPHPRSPRPRLRAGG